MKANISTTFATSEARMWGELQKVSSLLHVASPILVFRPCSGGKLPDRWEAGKEYLLLMFAFGIVPLGKHSILVKRIDPVKKEIETHESDGLATTWNHLLQIRRIDEHRVRYADEVDIEAGILTPFVWLFAHAFYRHRHRKWKRRLAELMSSS